VFRRGGDVSFVVEEMKAVFDPRGGAWMDGKYVPSLLAAIGDVIERHMIEIGFLPARGRRAAIGEQKHALGEGRGCAAGNALISDQRSGTTRMAQCPKCGEAALIRIEGCDQCTSCDYSKCW
jgi:ribonucleoside-diphosphate reductase alpha chain